MTSSADGVDGTHRPVDRRRHDRADMLSTSLLLELTTLTVDPAYVEAAASRASRGQSAPTNRHAATGLLLVALGLLGAIAFQHTREAAPEAARLRTGLIARVDQLTEQTEESHRELDRLREQIAADRDRALVASGADQELAASVRMLEFAAATSPVTGKGVVVTMSDAPATSDGAARIQDRDVQRAVNVAWAAGAEAVAVNGQRVGPLTAIRQAGESILVDYHPVVSPYRIAVIGDQAALERGFGTSDAMASLRAIANALDLNIEVGRDGAIVMGGTAADRASIARPVDAATSTERSPGP